MYVGNKSEIVKRIYQGKIAFNSKITLLTIKKIASK